MNIIEKLGITPGPWVKDYGATIGHIKSVATPNDRTPTVCRYDSNFRGVIPNKSRELNAKLMAAAPEMLEVLIESAISSEESIGYAPFTDIIEKATGKTWEEIKELINE